MVQANHVCSKAYKYANIMFRSYVHAENSDSYVVITMRSVFEACDAKTVCARMRLLPSMVSCHPLSDRYVIVVTSALNRPLLHMHKHMQGRRHGFESGGGTILRSERVHN